MATTSLDKKPYQSSPAQTPKRLRKASEIPQVSDARIIFLPQDTANL